MRTTAGWTGRSHGELPPNPTVVWHHDASPAGDSPGALQWMIDNYPTASAQLWIDRYGVVTFVGAGVAWHAGAVNNADYGNRNSIGIETDHTLFENWTAAQLDALRLTTAVILDKGGRKRTEFSFHRTIAVPAGRKVDPAGLDLAAERGNVYAIGRGPAPTPPQPPTVPTPAPNTPAPAPSPDWRAGTVVPPYPGRMIRYRDRAGKVITPAMRGHDVELLQARLNAHMRVLGQPQTGIDGVWGRDSDRVLRVMQYVRKLDVDGIAGPATYQAL